MRSSTAVEQILGRIMRLHQAKRKQRVELNMAYAFSASKIFVEAANALEDALIQNGFNRQEAKELITRMPAGEQGRLDLFYKVSEPLAEVPLLSVQQGDLFEPFEESHFLEIPWRLSKYPLTYLFSLVALVCRSRDTRNF